MLIPELIDKFLAWCARHREPETVAFYRGRLRLFRAAYSDREFGSLTPLEVDEHLAAAGEGKSNSTRRHNVVALERLQQWAVANKLLDRPIVGKLEKPAVGQRQQIPEPEETAKLLEHASPEFAAIYQALRVSAARPGELCRATIEDLQPPPSPPASGGEGRGEGACATGSASAGLRVRPGKIVLAQHKTARKTGRPREILVGKVLAEMLAAAIGDRTSGPIFLSPAGRAWNPRNLSRTYSRLRDAAGLPKHLVLYLARHEAGTNATRAKGIAFAQRLLGHASIQTTQRYTHLDGQELRDAQDLIAPKSPSPSQGGAGEGLTVAHPPAPAPPDIPPESKAA